MWTANRTTTTLTTNGNGNAFGTLSLNAFAGQVQVAVVDAMPIDRPDRRGVHREHAYPSPRALREIAAIPPARTSPSLGSWCWPTGSSLMSRHSMALALKPRAAKAGAKRLAKADGLDHQHSSQSQWQRQRARSGRDVMVPASKVSALPAFLGTSL
jgi:hypothetical protein